MVKASKDDVGYEPKASGVDHCGICAEFLAPDACRIVAGAIRAAGWCRRFRRGLYSYPRGSG
jgi:hypothetical protein